MRVKLNIDGVWVPANLYRGIELMRLDNDDLLLYSLGLTVDEAYKGFKDAFKFYSDYYRNRPDTELNSLGLELKQRYECLSKMTDADYYTLGS